METIYVKGMNTGDPEVDTEEDIWDDRKLNDAYDKALRMANLDVAQRIAMATNSQDKSADTITPNMLGNEKLCKQTKKMKQQKRNQAQNGQPKVEWKEGMPCRAVYHVDGFEYEAIVLTIIDDKECVIRFIGYNNTEIVPIADLQTTLGKEARNRQMHEAMMEKEMHGGPPSRLDDNDNSDAGSMENMPNGMPQQFPHWTENKKPKQRRPSNRSQMGDFFLPEMPMPDIAMLRQTPMDLPIPPPPLVGFRERAFGSDEGLTAMLLSWYMSGYHTGYYQGLKRARSGH